MPINRAAAKAAGYSDEEINAFEAEERRKGPPAVPQTASNEPPPPDQVAPPIPEVSTTGQLMGIGLAGSGEILSKAKDIAVPLGEGYLAYKGIEAWREHSAASKARAAAEAAAEAGRQARWEARNPPPPPAQPSARPGAQAFQQMGQQLGRPAPMAPSPGAAPLAPTPSAGMPPAAPQAQSNWIARAMEMARSIAPAMATGATPAAVGAGGATASYLAARQLANMTPEQRRALYENPMLGAMGGDAALGAAIMNQGR